MNVLKISSIGIITLLVLSLAITEVMAQEGDHEQDIPEQHNHHEFKHWRLGMGIGQSLLPSGTQSGTNVSVVVIPTISLDFLYWFKEKFGIGLINELEIISYVIESPDHNELEREYPFQIVFVGMYKIKNGPGIYLGPGIEIEKNKNFYIFKAGIDYEMELGNHWDVTPALYYFNKDGSIGGIGVAVVFGKRF